HVQQLPLGRQVLLQLRDPRRPGEEVAQNEAEEAMPVDHSAHFPAYLPSPLIRANTSFSTQWKSARWMLSTIPISSSGTCRPALAICRSFPPPYPVRPKVTRPWRLAQSTAFSTLGLLPEPLMAITRSPSRP